MQMKPLSLRFADPALEQSYLRDRLPQALRHNRSASMVGALTVICFILAGLVTGDPLILSVMPYRIAALVLFVAMMGMCYISRMQAFHDLVIALSSFGLWLLLWPLCL